MLSIFPYRFFTLIMFSISPAFSPAVFFFPPKNNEAQVENTLLVTELCCFEPTECTDNNSKGQNVFVIFVPGIEVLELLLR